MKPKLTLNLKTGIWTCYADGITEYHSNATSAYLLWRVAHGIKEFYERQLEKEVYRLNRSEAY